jgi:hypothetical protein
MKELVKPNKIEEQVQKVEAFCEPFSKSSSCNVCICFFSTSFSSTEEEEILF